MKLQLILLLATSTTLTACSSVYDDMLSQGYSPEYARGYDDGCHSGNQAAGSYTDAFTKNNYEYQREPEYADGWRDGFQLCQVKMQRTISQAEDISREATRQKRRVSSNDKRYSDMEHDAVSGIDTHGLDGL